MTEAGSWVVDEKIHALDFNGTTNFVEHAAEFVGDYPFTLEGWVKGDSNVGMHSIISFADTDIFTTYYAIYLVDGFPRLTARTSTIESIISPDSIIDGNWHHIVGVFASPTYRELVVDGVSKGTDTASISYWWWKIDTCLIGLLRKANPVGYFDGRISSARIYSYALSLGRIAQHYGDRFAMWELAARKLLPYMRPRLQLTATAAATTTIAGSLTIGKTESMTATAAASTTATGSLTVTEWTAGGFIRSTSGKGVGGYF